MKLSIIIPVFNEQDSITFLLKKIETLSLPVEKEIIVVDDSSFDNTKKILEKLRKEINFIFKEHKENQGKGAAIKTGLGQATGDIILIQDADLEYNPEDYPVLIEPLLRGEAEIVYGSRLLVKNPYSSKLYLFGGQFLTFVFNLLFGTNLTDINTGYKVFRKGILEKLNLREKRFAFCEEVTSKLIKNGYKIREVPIHYRPRSFREGKKIRWWRDGIRGLYVIMKNRIL